MRILQKIFSTLVLLSFMFVAITPVNAMVKYNYEDSLVKEIIIKKVNLKKIRTWDTYIKKVDKIITQIKTNREVLQKLEIKIYTTSIKLNKASKTAKIKKFIAILDYMSAKVKLELYRLSIAEAEQKAIEREEKEKEALKKLEAMKKSTLSETDTKLVNEKLVKIQLNLLENANKGLKNLVKDFENLSNYEEKGDFKLSFNLDHELAWKIKSELELKNYTAKTSGFNSQFSGQLKALIDSVPKWEDALKLQISSFIDFVSKDGNMYVLLNKLNITDEIWTEKIKAQLDVLKKLAEKNKYIKFEDRNTKQILETLKNLNPTKILADSKEVLGKPMFKAYEKNGDKYSLIPTKYACDKFKELNAKFDPWNGSTCSDSQYERMLKKLAESGDLYIEIWTHKNKLSFDAYPEYDIKSFNSYVIFTDTSIDEVKSELVTTKWTDWFKLEYLKNNKLNFDLNVWEEVQLELNSKLDRNNKFSFIDFDYNVKWYRSEVVADLKLENKKITWSFKSTTEKYDWYDYDTWKSKYKPGDIISWNLTWKQDYNNKLQDLELNISWVDAETKEQFLTAKLSKKSNNYTFILNITEDKKTVFDTNVKLNNKKISGVTKVFDRNWKEYLKITHTWRYETDLLELNNKFELSESLITMYSGQTSKARDMTRKSALISLEIWIEQYYSDNSEYPTTIVDNKDLEYYLWRIPTDPSWNIEIDWCKFGYYYEVWNDKNGIENGEYRLSSCLENWEKMYKWNYSDSFKANEYFYINDYTTWTKQEAEKEEKPKVQADINIKIDVRWNKNNANIYIDYIEWDDKILEIELDNKGTLNYKKVDIETPTNTMELEEAMWIEENPNDFSDL